MAVIVIKKKVDIVDETFKKLSLWVIPVEIKGVNKILTYNLLLDTGAERTVLDPYVQKEVGIELKQESKRSGGLIYQMADVDIEIASIPLGTVEVLIGKLPGGEEQAIEDMSDLIDKVHAEFSKACEKRNLNWEAELELGMEFGVKFAAKLKISPKS